VEKATKENIVKKIAELKESRIILNNAEIVEKTGFSKSYVSNIAAGKQAAGEHFIEKFNNVFLSTNSRPFSVNNISLTDLSTVKNGKYKSNIVEEDGEEYQISETNNTTMKERMKLLEENIEDLRETVRTQRSYIAMLEKANAAQGGIGQRSKQAVALR